MEKEELYKDLLEELPDLFVYNKIVTDKDGQPIDFEILFANKAFESLLGIKVDSLINKRFTAIFPEFASENFDVIRKFGEVALTEGSACFEQKKYIGSTVRWYGINTYSNKKGYFVATAKDITEHKLIGNFLNERIKELACLFNIATSSLDVERNLTLDDLLSRAVNIIPTGFQHPQNICARIIIEEGTYETNNFKVTEAKMYSELFYKDKCLGTLEVYYLREREKVKDSDLFLKEEQDLVDAIAGILSSVIEAYIFEEALEKSEENLSITLQSIGDGVIVTDNKGYITRMNPWAEKLTGWNYDQAVGKPIEEVFYIVGAKKGDIVINPIHTVLETGEVENMANDTILIARDGQRYHIADSAAPIIDNNGNVSGVVMVFSDFTKRKKHEEELKYLSFHDKLTGVYNRSYFEKEIERLEGIKEYPISIISADIDGLKIINESMGFEVGDYYLKTGVNVLKKSVKENDILARIGGDEFAVILPHTDKKDAEEIVRKIYKNTERTNKDYPELPISISVGSATARTKDISLKELLKKADDAMYRSKMHKGASVKSYIIDALMATLNERDYITSGHVDRLEDLCRKMGEELQLTSGQHDNLALLAKVHDLGKVGIPDSILFKPGPLDEDEWEVMRLHPEKGYRIALSSPELAGIAELILKHHEKWDGTGYPLGIKGKGIPIESRILAIVDAYDAMTNERPYAKAKGKEEALAEIKRCAGTQFDPELVDIFISIV